MQGITLSFSNHLNQERPFDSETVLKTGMKLLIQNKLEAESRVSLVIINPFNYIMNHFFLSSSSQKLISIHFNDFLPSGRYNIKIVNLVNSKPEETNEVEEETTYYSFQFIGTFSNFSWSITYAVSCTVKSGMDIRLAVPRQNFPFFLVESLEGKPINTFTTDVWSNWLLYDTTAKIGTNNIMFGYRSVVHGNYIIFTPESLSNHVSEENNDQVKYLMSENGIESSDQLLKDFATNITAKTVFGIIHQILYLVTEHLTFKDQLGEFGAKYALLNRQGDCTEYSALFTALCRIKKIPARLVAGLKRISSKKQDNWIRHAWSEIYYQGLWIPIDVVEGKSKIIGHHPDIIPLFKGNWMADNMNRELKISIMDENTQTVSLNDLVESYTSLSISYKVQEAIQNDFNDQKEANFVPDKQIEIQGSQELKINTKVEFVLHFDELEKNNILGVFYKSKTDEKVKTPKLVYLLEQLLEKKTEKHTINVTTPENPGTYDLGIFICSPYGEIVAVSSLPLSIKS